MREHKNKAKRLDNGEWIEGYYWQNGCGNHFIRVILDCDKIVIQDYEIDPNTLCEFTGLTDKNGNMIWEHDIVAMKAYGGGKWYSAVYYHKGKFAVDGSNYHFKDLAPSTYEVIGNIFDNPELLEGK